MQPDAKRFSVSSLEQLAALLSTEPGHIEYVLSHLHQLYRHETRRKPNGTERDLWIPRDPLRPLQDKIQSEVLTKIPQAACVQGGVKGRSIITNAKHHVGKPALSTMDIRNCFPSINVNKVQKVFDELGFSSEALSIITKLTTWKFQLPQGPPTSPLIANLALAKLDRRQMGIAKKHRFTYTRYVDDLASSGGRRLRKVRRLQERIVESEGFSIKPLKDGQQKIMHRERDRQQLTGLVLNQKINLPREKRKEIIGGTKASLQENGTLSESEHGKILWLASVNAQAGSAVVRAARLQRKKK